MPELMTMLPTDKSMTAPKKYTPLDDYFANKPRAEIADFLLKKVDDYYEHLISSKKMSLYRRSYEYYYQGLVRNARLQKTGKQDEYTTMAVNHYRNLLIHLLVQTTNQRPTFEPRATNTDYKSQAQTKVAAGVLDYYAREKKLERYIKAAVEHALVYAESYLAVEWDATAGDDVAADGEQTIKSGEVEFTNFTPIDVIIDFTKTSAVGHNWRITRKFVNKYDVAARYPELADKIIKTSVDPMVSKDRRIGTFDYKDSDEIPRYRFYHDKTPAVPEGRFVEFYSSDLVTLDGPLPYPSMPIYRLAPDELEGTPFGYTVGWDLLALQEAIDGLYSTIITNQSSFGVQNIIMPDGCNIGVEEVLSGLNLIKYDPKTGKPEALNLTNTPKEIFAFISQLEKVMETLAGINSVVRGNPEASLKSGAALALVAAQAIQFNSGLQQSYAQLLEDAGTGVINILKQFPQTPRLALIAGKSNRTLMQQFTSDDLSEINRVTVDMGNPLSRTTAGKLQIAEDLLNKGLLKTPEEYIQVATTGNLESLLEGEEAQILLIRAENEKLSDESQKVGQEPDPTWQPDPMNPNPQQPPMRDVSSVVALITDNAILHIKEHQSVLASPEARENPVIVRNTLAHLREHIELLQSGDPLLAILGQPSLAPQIAPFPGGDGSGGGPVSETMDATNPVTKEAQSVNMPSMPKNPMTGEKYDPAMGQ